MKLRGSGSRSYAGAGAALLLAEQGRPSCPAGEGLGCGGNAAGGDNDPSCCSARDPLSDDDADEVSDGDSCFSTCSAGRGIGNPGAQGDEAAADEVSLTACPAASDSGTSGRGEDSESEGCLGCCSAENTLGHKGDDIDCEGIMSGGSARDPASDALLLCPDSST